MYYLRKLTSHDKVALFHLIVGIGLLVCFYQEAYLVDIKQLEYPGSTTGWRSLSNVLVYLSLMGPPVCIYSFYEKGLSFDKNTGNLLKSLWILVLAFAIQFSFNQMTDIFTLPTGQELLSFKKDIYLLNLFTHYKEVFFRYTMLGFTIRVFNYDLDQEKKQ